MICDQIISRPSAKNLMPVISYQGQFRFTPFRQAIASRVFPSHTLSSSDTSFGENDPTRDLLVMSDLRVEVLEKFKYLFQGDRSEAYYDLLNRFQHELFRWTSAERFFDMPPDVDLYCPVPIYVKGHPDSCWIDLANLLHQLHESQDGHGVLLSARSGGGKTVAAWGTFLQSIFGENRLRFPDQSQAGMPAKYSPRSALPYPQKEHLHQLNPLWLDVSVELNCSYTDERLILALIAENTLAHLKIDLSAKLRLVHRQLLLGSPLLLFFDLNHAKAEFRKRYPQALVAFQKKYGQQQSHRAVVIYRAAGRTDAILDTLVHQNAFREYDLKPLQDEVALGYLTRKRQFEQDLYQHLNNWLKQQNSSITTGLSLPEIDLAAEHQQMRRLLTLRRRTMQQMSANLEDLEEQETIISVPLLMHWVSQIDPAQRIGIESLSDIYRLIIDQHSAREHRAGHTTIVDLSWEDLLVGMTRIALVLLARHPFTHLKRVEFESCLSEPITEHSPDVLGKDSWWPVGELLTSSPYYRRKFTPEEIEELLGRGMFRWSGEEIGFVHDSLIYYFAARSLREYTKPRPQKSHASLTEEWGEAVLQTFLANPQRWPLAADFLGEMINPAFQFRKTNASQQTIQTARQLIQKLVAYWPVDLSEEEATAFMKPVPEIVSRLCANLSVDRTLRQVGHAVNNHDRFAWERPHLLLQEVYNRCRFFGAEGSEVEQWAVELLLQAHQHDQQTITLLNRPEWLRQTEGPCKADTLTMDVGHTGWINSLIHYKNADREHCIASVGDDERLILTRIDEGGNSRRSTSPLDVGHTRPILSLDYFHVADNEHSFVTAGWDGRLIVTRLDDHGDKNNSTELDVGHTGEIHSLVHFRNADGEHCIVSAGHDKRLIVTRLDDHGDKKGSAELDVGHTDSIISLVHFQNAEDEHCIASAGHDGRLILTRLDELDEQRDSRRSTLPLDVGHTSSVTSLVHFKNTNHEYCIASAGRDGRLIVTKFDEQGNSRGSTSLLDVRNTYSLLSLVYFPNPTGEHCLVSAGWDRWLIVTRLDEKGNSRGSTLLLDVGHTDAIFSLVHFQNAESEHCIVSAGRDERLIMTRLDDLDNSRGSNQSLDVEDIIWDSSLVEFQNTNGEYYIASAGRDERLIVTLLDDKGLPHSSKKLDVGHNRGITSLVYFQNDDEYCLATSGRDGLIQFWRLSEILQAFQSPYNLPQPKPFSILHVLARAMTYDPQQHRLICTVDEHLEIFQLEPQPAAK